MPAVVETPPPAPDTFTCGGRSWLVGQAVHVREDAGPGFDGTVDGGMIQERPGCAPREVLLVRLRGSDWVLVVLPEQVDTPDGR